MASGLLLGNGTEFDVPTEWSDRPRVIVEPIAAPSILLYVFPFVFSFVAVFGGLAPFVAYRARDALGTAMHGRRGSFRIVYGILFALVAPR